MSATDVTEKNPAKIALLGCGTVGSEVCRLLARAGRRPGRADRGPAGGGRHRGARPGRARGTRPSTAALLTTDAMGLATRPDIDIVIEVIGGIEPARVAAAGGDEGRQVGGHREQGPAGRGRRGAARGRPGRAASTCTTRRPWPGRSRCCARCASRWPATPCTGCSASSTAPPTTSWTGWTPPARASPSALERGPGPRLRRGRPDRGRGGLRRGGQGRDPGQPGLPHRGHRRGRVPRGHHRGDRRRHRQRPGAGLRGQAAGHLRAVRTAASRSGCTRR